MVDFWENPKNQFFIRATLQGDMIMIHACECHSFKALIQFLSFHSINHDIWTKKLQNPAFSSENRKTHWICRFSSQKFPCRYCRPSSESIWTSPDEICLQETHYMLFYQIPCALRMHTCPQTCRAHKSSKSSYFY